MILFGYMKKHPAYKEIMLHVEGGHHYRKYPVPSGARVSVKLRHTSHHRVGSKRRIASGKIIGDHGRKWWRYHGGHWLIRSINKGKRKKVNQALYEFVKNGCVNLEEKYDIVNDFSNKFDTWEYY